MKFFRVIRDILLYWLSRIIPKRSNQIAFGGWMGRLYADNPRYLFEYMLKKDFGYRMAWIGEESLRDRMPHGARFIAMGSFKSIWYLMRSRYWVFCQWEHDMSSYPLWGGSICLNLFHGIPLKYIGKLTSKHKAETAISEDCGALKRVWRKLFKRLIPKPKEWTVVASDENARIFADGCPDYFSRDRVLPVGTPRNDFILNCSQEQRGDLRKKYARIFGYDPAKKVVLYAPTFRLSGKRPFTFYGLGPDLRKRWSTLLERRNAVLIEKHHFHTLEMHEPKVGAEGAFRVVERRLEQVVDTQELLVAADVLITDYSSLFVDYSLQGRPCIHFVYDLEEYMRSDSGLAYDLTDVAGGPVVQTEAELAKTVDEILTSSLSGKRGACFAKLVEYECGRACEGIVRWLEKQTALSTLG